MFKVYTDRLALIFSHRLPPWSVTVACVVAVIAAASIAGWFTDSHTPARLLPGWSPMPLNTALALLLLAGAWGVLDSRPSLAGYVALAAALLAVDALVGHGLGRPSGFTTLTGIGANGDRHGEPWTMARNTGWAIILLTVALPALSRGRPGGYLEWIGIASASATLGMAALALLVILSPADLRARWSHGASMGAHSAICLAALAGILLRRPRAPISSQRMVTRSMALAIPLLLAAALTGYVLIEARAGRQAIAVINTEAGRAAANMAVELEALAVASNSVLRHSDQTDTEALDLLTEAFPYVVRVRRLDQPAGGAPMRFGITRDNTRVTLQIAGDVASVLNLELVPQLLAERLSGTPRGVHARLAVRGQWVPDSPPSEHWLSSAQVAVPLPQAGLALQFWYPSTGRAVSPVPAITVPALTAVTVLLGWLIAQHAILRAQSRELALFETTSEAILVADDQGVIESINRPALTLLSADETELVGQNLKRLLPDLTYTSEPPGVAGTAANRQLLTARKHDGGLLPVEAKVSEVRLRNSLFWVVALRDLSERQQLEREIHTRNTVFDIALRASPVGFVMTDADGCITEYNPAFANWLGAGDTGLVGTPISAWVSPEHRPALLLACHRLRTRALKTFTMPVLGWRRAVPSRWGKVSAAGIFLGEDSPLDAISLKFVDTDAEQRLTRQLAETNQFLTAKNQELDQFAYIASHDLKEPLRTLRVYSDYLIKDLAANRPERVTQDAEFIRKAAARMSSLIDDLLQLSRAGNAPLRCETLSLSSCLQHAISAVQAALDTAAAEVKHPDYLPNVMGDEQQLTRVFVNLLGNAIKFRSPDRPLQITIECVQVDQGWEVGVVDNGIGIPTDKTREVLAPFKRLHSQAEVEGSGIGLAIVNKIIERHGGSLRLEPQAVGTAAIIRLPNNQQEAFDEL